MKILKEFVLPVLVVAITLYLLFGFIAWSWNPFYWTAFLRTLYVILIIFSLLVFEEDDTDPDNSILRENKKSIGASVSELFEQKLKKQDRHNFCSV